MTNELVAQPRWFFGAEPERVVAVCHRDPDFGTDRLTSAILDFGDGRTCVFSASTQCVPHQRVDVFGTTARLQIIVPFNQPPSEPTVYLVDHGRSVWASDAERHEVATNDQYTSQGDAFSKRVREESPTDGPLRDAIANMRIIDAVFRSSESGRFETI